MGREEQAEEREVLASIFPDEITDLDEHSFRIEIALDMPREDGKEMPPSTILLTVGFPESYPDIAPNLTLSHPPNSAKPSSLDLSHDGPALLEALDSTVTESLGMAMIFTLVAALKDAAEQLIGERASAVEAASEAVRRAEEEKEDAKFHGEKVTRERFLVWRDNFFEEMAQAEEKKRVEDVEALGKKGAKIAVKEEEKMTGRQLWETGMAGKGWEEDEGDALAGIEELRVDG